MIMAKAAILVALLAVAVLAPLAEARSAACTRPKDAAFEHSIMRRSLKSNKAPKKFKLGSKPHSGGDSKCGEWKVGTATGYSTDGTDHGDKPMAPNDLGEWVVPGKFFKKHNVVAVDWSDWSSDRYHYVEVALEGKVGRVEVWDFCNDKDCSKDNANCCSDNMKKYKDKDGSGYLLDVETHACKKMWGLEGCQNWLVAPVWYRVCGKFDQKKSVKKYKMECAGVNGDHKCYGYNHGH